LLEGLRRRDRFACTCLLKRFMPRLYRLALQVTGSSDEAQDVLQESFIKACGQVERFDGRSELGTWLYRIVLNSALMHLRTRKADMVSLTGYEDGQSEDQPALVERIPAGGDPGDEMVARELREKLDQAILRLPDSLRAALVLRDLEELSTKDSAEALGISEAALKVRLHRARLALREALDPYFPEHRPSAVSPGTPAGKKEVGHAPR
jgi:RNA polymerase sigma-70 factor, ECF subfamily